MLIFGALGVLLMLKYIRNDRNEESFVEVLANELDYYENSGRFYREKSGFGKNEETFRIYSNFYDREISENEVIFFATILSVQRIQDLIDLEKSLFENSDSQGLL